MNALNTEEFFKKLHEQKTGQEDTFEERYSRISVARNARYGSRIRLSWRQTAINLAFDIADYRSEDPFTQVGACALKKDGFEVGVGYNGPPSGIDINWRDRDAKNERVLHAEANVLNRCLPGEVELIAVTHMPCKVCLKTIAQKQISLVIFCIVIPKYEPELVIKLAEEFHIQLVQMNPTTKNAPKSLEYSR